MKRREFITLLGGAAASPIAAGAQQPVMPVVGYLDNSAPQDSVNLLAAFRKGLSEIGYVEGHNVAIEVRFAEGDRARLPALAADLVRRRVTVIVAGGGVVVGLAAKAATTSIPIVFNSAGDPVKAGLVSSLNQPGGNVTGVNSMSMELGAKRLSFLHGTKGILVIAGPKNRSRTTGLLVDFPQLTGKAVVKSNPESVPGPPPPRSRRLLIGCRRGEAIAAPAGSSPDIAARAAGAVAAAARFVYLEHGSARSSAG